MAATTKTRKNTARFPKGSQKDRDTLDGLALLEVDSADVEREPKVEHILKTAIGARDRVFEYLEGSESPIARQLLDLKKRLTRRQYLAVPFEAFCLAARIPVKEVFGMLSAEVMDQGARATKMMLHAQHPQVLRRTIDRAMAFDGTADAKMLHQAMRTVPVPRNTVNVINGDVTKNEQHIHARLPSVEDTGRRLANRFNADMSIPDAIPAQLVADDEEDQEQD